MYSILHKAVNPFITPAGMYCEEQEGVEEEEQEEEEEEENNKKAGSCKFK